MTKRKIFSDRWEIIKALPEGGQGFIYEYEVKDKKGDNSTPFVLKRLKNISRLPRFEK